MTRHDTEKTLRVAIVTGAGSGIGRATVHALANDGWCVALAGRRQEALDAVIRDYEQHVPESASKLMAIATDVTDSASVQRLFDTVQERYGRLDLLFNNAGVGVEGVSVEDLSIERFRTMLDINVIGTLLCTQAAFRRMRANNPPGGRVINNGSLSAHTPRLHSADYTASKHAVSGLTKACALDGRKYDIAVCQIDFGNVLTEMAAGMAGGVLQANGERAPEPTMDLAHAAQSVAYMASMPPGANVQFMTVMATKMPFIGRG
ncbi:MULTISPECIES: SDR family oxidoreductase [unclassified Caballeronia]|uniref:SDR family oxidoreductase n=1 Tax=unclassified Caballeronia TaxID=2646786 RepID=UPI00285A6E6D|nr:MULTISPECIES: SDR family oxidoreductase [unclassified Caballeronia]MDR5773276.1 SDR family NAD(P)-dependent oxidoreductase [Caballeronia sp. LZ002]MDR5806049.1 SDR family NAD(P)-dependent oxidoreductase [Caballeronia sp. LZ001]MDR5848710.1 SDR family NAD(P)-dependent oxidoreductase [Caballeronia sp. LZ003]